MKQLTKVLFAFILLLSLSSCGVSSGTPSKAYIPTSYSVYKGGYWGEWHSLVYRYIGDHVLDVYVRHGEREEEITIYRKGNHPSDYIHKIVINKLTGKDAGDGWKEYKATVTQTTNYLAIGDLLPGNEYYNRSFQVKVDSKFVKSMERGGLYGTINVFTGNGEGFAYCFTP